MELLLAANANANKHSNNNYDGGLSLIQEAVAQEGMTDTVRALIAAGAGKEARSNFEQFIWLLASDKPNNDILEYVVREGYWLHRLKEPDRADLVTAVESSDLDQLRILVKRSHQRANDLASAIRAGDLSETIRIIGSILN